MAEDEGFIDEIAERLIERMVAIGIDGAGPLDPAAHVAEEAMAEHGNIRDAVDAIVADHTKLVGASGFVTGLGGLVTLVVALPANVAGFSILATRMVAGIAAVRGHDLQLPETRAAVLLTVTGTGASDLLTKAGVAVPGGRVAAVALKGMPKSTIAFVNKGIAFRLLARTLGKGAARLGRLIPIVGGAVGAGVDVGLLRSIARHAKEDFPLST
jgi:hypothetical protein